MVTPPFDPPSVQLAELLAEIRSYLPDLELESIENGLRKRNRPQAVTVLRLTLLDASSADGRPLGLAQIITEIVDPDFDRLEPWDVATANRWAVWGHIRRLGAGELEVRSSVTLFWGAPDGWKTYAGCIARAFREQAAFAMAALSSRVSEDEFRTWRNSYSRPRAWTAEPPAEAFARTAERVRRTGLGSEARDHQLEFFQPLPPDSFWCDSEARGLRVQISSNYTHPIAGVGYSATLTLPRIAQAAELAEYLNTEEERQVDFAPRFGAWGVTSGTADVVYSLFWPAVDGAESAGMIEQIAAWQLGRAKWLVGLISRSDFFQGRLRRGYRQMKSRAEKSFGLRDRFLNSVLDYLRSEPIRSLVTDVERRADSVVFRRTPGPGLSTVSVQGEDNGGDGGLCVTVKTEAIPELQKLLWGREHGLNVMAGTAGLLAHRGGMAFVASAPLERWSAGLCLGLTLEATGPGISAILGENPQDREEDRPLSLSAWGAIELERLIYTYSHHPLNFSRKGLTLLLQRDRFFLSIELTPRARHPALSSGMLCLLRVRSVKVPQDRQTGVVNALNASEFHDRETPFFGAWCVDSDGSPAFATFIGNKGPHRDALAEYLFGSLLLRADDFPNRFIGAWTQSIVDDSPEAV